MIQFTSMPMVLATILETIGSVLFSANIREGLKARDAPATANVEINFLLDEFSILIFI
jgi:hypothetical protein